MIDKANPFVALMLVALVLIGIDIMAFVALR